MTLKQTFPETAPAQIEAPALWPWRIDYSKPLQGQVSDEAMERARILEAAAELLAREGWVGGTMANGSGYCAVGAMSQIIYANPYVLLYSDADQIYYGRKRQAGEDTVFVLNDGSPNGDYVVRMLTRRAHEIRNGG